MRNKWAKHLKVWFNDEILPGMKEANPGLPDKIRLGKEARLSFVERDSETGMPLYSVTLRTPHGWQTVPFSSDTDAYSILSLDDVYEQWQTRRLEQTVKMYEFMGDQQAAAYPDGR
jgi:hypothetical protein